MSLLILASLLVPAMSFGEEEPMLEASAEASASASSNAHADFNGDGFDDLAIGFPEEDIGTIANAGAVNVIYGSSSGLSATAVPDQFWTQNSPDIEETAETSELFGATLASGDFNNDGYGDLAIGVPEEDLSTIHAGVVHVIYGSASGLSATFIPDQLWDQNSPDVEDAVEQDKFGSSLAVGDFNKDSYDDLAIGAPRETLVNPTSNVGAVNVIYGSSQGLRATAVSGGNGHVDQIWTQDSAGIEDTAEYTDQFGSSLSTGDYNGDGSDDLAIGSWGEDIGDPKKAVDHGAVNVIYGSSLGLRSTAVASGDGRSDQFWHQNSTGIEEVAEGNDRFGFVLASGDFNKDGRDDLAAGVPGEVMIVSGTNLGDVGVVNVIYGSSQGLRASAVSAVDGRADQLWSQNTGGIEDASENHDRWGSSLTVGDFNGDTADDLAVGVPFEDAVCCSANQGSVNVIYGSSLGLRATAVSAGDGRADQIWSQDSASVEDAAEVQDRFGQALSCGDYNNDGRDDLAIGVREGFGTIPSAGAVNVIYGSGSGLSATIVPDQLWSQDSPGIEDSVESSDNWQFDLALA